MKNFKNMLMIGFVVSIGTQFYLNFFIDGFIITASVVILPILLYVYNYLPPIPTLLTVSVISPLVRYILELFKTLDYRVTLSYVGPDVTFYLAYALNFYILYESRNSKTLKRFVLTVLFCDFFSNLVELSVRANITGMNFNMIRCVFGIAVVRTAIVFFIILLLKKYKSILEREEHELRYRKLYTLTAFFKSESYYINKNMNQIEKLTKKGYQIHKIISQKKYDLELENKTLEFAKDIHEVKKDYQQIVQGMNMLSDENLNKEPMQIKDIVNISISSIKENKKNIYIKTDIKCNVFVKNHYYFSSIIRNIINNSVEACDNNKSLIHISVYKEGDWCIIVVSDTGKGIKQEYIDSIFTPGFSTKYDKKTGDIFRGLGLPIIKDLVENHFKGYIKVDSKQNIGTTVTIKIPKNEL